MTVTREVVGRTSSLVLTPAVVAHRGASGHRPEHTLEAYRNLRRTVTVDGVAQHGWFVQDLTLAELKTVAARERDALGDMAAEVRALLAAGVDGVITDHPEAALAAVRAHARASLAPWQHPARATYAGSRP